MKEFFLIIIYSLIKFNCAFPNGAPASVCNTLRPNHIGIAPQDSESPFKLVISKTSIVGGENLTIEIQSPDELHFKGFFLVAFPSADTPKALGEFLADEETLFNFRDCGDGSQNAVTHFNISMKRNISFKWKAPEDFTGLVHFQ